MSLLRSYEFIIVPPTATVGRYVKYYGFNEPKLRQNVELEDDRTAVDYATRLLAYYFKTYKPVTREQAIAAGMPAEFQRFQPEVIVNCNNDGWSFTVKWGENYYDEYWSGFFGPDRNSQVPTPTPTPTPTATPTPTPFLAPTFTPTPTPTPTQVPEYRTDGLVSYYNFGMTGSYPGSGSVIRNLVGPGLLELQGSPTYSLTRVTKTGYMQFNSASGDYAYGSSSLPLLPSWSVEMWIQTPRLPLNDVSSLFCSEYGSGNVNYNIGIQRTVSKTYSWRNSTLTSGIYVNGISFWYETDGNLQGRLSSATWYHVVGTYDGSNLYFYVNSQPNLTKPNKRLAQGGPNHFLMAPPDTVPGVEPVKTKLYSGGVSLIRIYGRALTPTEVNDTYNASKNSYR